MEKMKPEFTLSRTFEMPIQKVFDAYTKEEHLCNWWGSTPFDLTVCELDFQVNGRFFYGLSSTKIKIHGVFDYLEIEAPNMFRFINYFADSNGFPIRHPMIDTWPMKMMNTYAFKEEEEKTELLIRTTAFEAKKEELDTFKDRLSSMEAGFKGALDKLEEYLKTMD